MTARTELLLGLTVAGLTALTGCAAPQSSQRNFVEISAVRAGSTEPAENSNGKLQFNYEYRYAGKRAVFFIWWEVWRDGHWTAIRLPAYVWEIGTRPPWHGDLTGFVKLKLEHVAAAGRPDVLSVTSAYDAPTASTGGDDFVYVWLRQNAFYGDGVHRENVSKIDLNHAETLAWIGLRYCDPDMRHVDSRPNPPGCPLRSNVIIALKAALVDSDRPDDIPRYDEQSWSDALEKLANSVKEAERNRQPIS